MGGGVKFTRRKPTSTCTHTYRAGQAQTHTHTPGRQIPLSQTRTLNHTYMTPCKSIKVGLNTCLILVEKGKEKKTHTHTHTPRYSKRSLSSSQTPSRVPLLWLKAAVLRKAVITATKPFTENQNEVPDGKALCCVERQ